MGVVHHLNDPAKAVEEFARVAHNSIVMLYNRDSLLWAYSSLHGIDIERAKGVRVVEPFTKAEAESLFHRFYRDVIVSTHYQVIDLPSERKVKLNIPEGLGLGWNHVVRSSR